MVENSGLVRVFTYSCMRFGLLCRVCRLFRQPPRRRNLKRPNVIKEAHQKNNSNSFCRRKPTATQLVRFKTHEPPSHRLRQKQQSYGRSATVLLRPERGRLGKIYIHAKIRHTKPQDIPPSCRQTHTLPKLRYNKLQDIIPFPVSVRPRVRGAAPFSPGNATQSTTLEEFQKACRSPRHPR